MNCVINSSIIDHIRKGKKLEVIRRYIEMKYRISIDMESLKERIKLMNLKLDF
ncbi:hypothetical protein [Nafulsella turpanensis]|uniref:hypothetical protein n=1 Tax=Nafulsella turpanensis TaxID=1265690 RepID=UPI00034A54D2|nr:hypothetical protein [Nafulsella turpanensis]